MTATDQPKFVFREINLTPEKQERIIARVMRSIRKAWDAAK